MSAKTSGAQDTVMGRLLPEKRIYIRSGRRTRYFSLSGRTQVAISALIAVTIGWGAFATTSYVTRAVDSRSAEFRVQNASEAYEARLAAMEARQVELEKELNRANERRDMATARLGEKQQHLVQTIHQLQETDTELQALRAELGALQARHEAEAARTERLAGELVAARIALADAEAGNAALETSIAAVSEAIDDVIIERDFAVARTQRLTGEVGDLRSEIALFEGRQDRLLAQLESAAEVGLTGLDRMFRKADIDLDTILDNVMRNYSGAGGPFEPLDENESEAGNDEGDMRVAALMQDLETVSLMKFAADRLPFTMPVNGGRFTSPFGPRRDPLRRRVSMHNGMDIAGPRGTPIVATADGVVTFAGRQRGYGILVKIRHAFGFETVYAHLNKARVTVGQRVERGDRIGDMGNTGRSTGVHLHYEVRIDKEPVNPMKFIEAARDVL